MLLVWMGCEWAFGRAEVQAVSSGQQGHSYWFCLLVDRFVLLSVSP
jgi:hypothetical protein